MHASGAPPRNSLPANLDTTIHVRDLKVSLPARRHPRQDLFTPVTADDNLVVI
jgi:hypothetical protein